MGANLRHWLKQGLGSFVGVLLGASLVTVVNAHTGPLASGVIHACINNNSGTFKLTTPTGVCAQGETPLDWNGQGPKGDKGDQGPVGISGYEVVWDLNQDLIKTVTPETSAVQGKARCPRGKSLLGGGGRLTPLDANGAPVGGGDVLRYDMADSYPGKSLIFVGSDPVSVDTWHVTYYVAAEPADHVPPPVNRFRAETYAICANVAT